jgi:hypothetical protein
VRPVVEGDPDGLVRLGDPAQFARVELPPVRLRGPLGEGAQLVLERQVGQHLQAGLDRPLARVRDVEGTVVAHDDRAAGEVGELHAGSSF